MRIFFIVVVLATLIASDISAQNCDLNSILGFPGRPTIVNVRNCLENGGDVYARGRHGETMLFLAALRSDDAEVVQLLLAKGADVNAVNEDGRSTLHVAALAVKNLDIVTILIEAGADLEARESRGYTLLHATIINAGKYIPGESYSEKRWSLDADKMRAIRMFVLAGADVNTRNNKGETPLHTTALLGGQPSGEFSNLIEILTTAGANVDAYIDERHAITPLIAYIYFALDFEEEVSTLIAAGANVNLSSEMNGMTPLHFATCLAGRPDNLIILIEAGADVAVLDHKGRRPFDCAKENPWLIDSTGYLLLQQVTLNLTVLE